MSLLIQFIPHWILYALLFGGIIGTVLTIIGDPIIPFQYKICIQVGSAVALAISPFFLGSISTEERWQLEVLKQKAEISRIEAESQKVTTEVVTKYLEKKIYIKEKGNEIIKKIPVYITQKSDNNCVIPNGFVRLHNDAAENKVSDPTGISNDTASPVKLSEVGSTVAENYNKYHTIEEQLRSLQSWVLEQQRVMQ